MQQTQDAQKFPSIKFAKTLLAAHREFVQYHIHSKYHSRQPSHRAEIISRLLISDKQRAILIFHHLFHDHSNSQQTQDGRV